MVFLQTYRNFSFVLGNIRCILQSASILQTEVSDILKQLLLSYSLKTQLHLLATEELACAPVIDCIPAGVATTIPRYTHTHSHTHYLYFKLEISEMLCIIFIKGMTQTPSVHAWKISHKRTVYCKLIRDTLA